MKWRNLILLLPAWFALPAHAEAVLPAPGAPRSCQAAAETYDQSLTTFAAIPKSFSRPQSPSRERDGLSPKELLATASKQLQEADRRSGNQSGNFAVALINVATASRDAGLYIEALAAVNEAEVILARVVEGSDILGDALRERGIIHSRLRQHDEALAAFDKAIAIYEAKLGANSDKAALAYRTKADILRGLNRFSDALLSLGRARVAYERRQPERAGDLAEVLIDTSIIHSRINRLQMALSLANEAAAIASGALGQVNRITARALHNVAIALRRLEIGLSAQSAEAQGELVKLHLDMLGQARKKLRQFGDRAVLLQIASLDETVHLFLTTGQAQVHHSEPISRKRMARLAFDAWSAVAHREPDADAKLKMLYDILIRPLESELKASGAEVIMLNLEGFLRYIPFAALTDGSHYLAEDYALTLQTPAADTTYVKGERDRTRAAGFGVTDGYREFSGLPAVASELELIFDGADDSGVFRGKPQLNAAFTVDGFATALEERPLFVHIASHFKLTPGDEAQSYLLLGNGATLSLETIRSDARFQFTDVDLLTLSACETAGEVGTDGKEVESFATLAQGSGASSVLATLWPIADQATAKLMGNFYANLLTGGLDKATALQNAQIDMIRADSGGAVALITKRGFTPSEEGDPHHAPIILQSHPYHWSAFILMGNWL